MLTAHFSTWSTSLCALARAAGAVALHHRQQATEATRHKPDGSPVTDADHEAEAVILAGLAGLSPSIPVIAEEKTNDPKHIQGGSYWLVDPLDGTREYVSGRDEFTVNIALMVEHQPVLGVLYAPALDDLFYAAPGTVWREQAGQRVPITSACAANGPMRLITSKREARRLPVQDWLAEGLIGEWRVCSSAYKFGLLAAGEYDCFLRTGTTYEWDTAAGHAILLALGGQVLTLDGAPMSYAKPDFRNGNFIATLPGISHAAVDRLIAKVKQAL